MRTEEELKKVRYEIELTKLKIQVLCHQMLSVEEYDSTSAVSEWRLRQAEMIKSRSDVCHEA